MASGTSFVHRHVSACVSLLQAIINALSLFTFQTAAMDHPPDQQPTSMGAV